MTQVSGVVTVFLCFSMHPGTHLTSSISYVLLGKINFPLALKSYDSALSLMSKSGHGGVGGRYRLFRGRRDSGILGTY